MVLKPRVSDLDHGDMPIRSDAEVEIDASLQVGRLLEALSVTLNKVALVVKNRLLDDVFWEPAGTGTLRQGRVGAKIDRGHLTVGALLDVGAGGDVPSRGRFFQGQGAAGGGQVW